MSLVQENLDSLTDYSRPIEKKRKRFLRLTAFACFCLFFFSYLAVSPLVAKKVYYRVLFQSFPYPNGYYSYTNVDGVEARNVLIPSSDGVLLHGWYFKKPNSKKVVLMHHGNGGNISILQWYVDLILKSDASVLVYDYRGYGKSSGVSSLIGICEDAEHSYNYLISKEKWKPEQVVNMGFSLGTGPASFISAKKKCAGTILISPYASLQEVGKHHLPWLYLYPPVLWPEPDLNNLDYVKNFHAPVLLMHGDDDQLIPYSNSVELKKSINVTSKLLSMPCGHGDLGEVHDLIQTNISEFIRSLKI